MTLISEILQGRIDVLEEEVDSLAGMVKDTYTNMPNVVTLSSRETFFVGDLHGDLEAAKAVYRIFTRAKDAKVIFLGDYADRGPFQAETVNLVFALALRYPENVILLRGNHESESVAKRYGFYEDVTKKYSSSTFRTYLQAYAALPIAAIVNDDIFACHGGVPENVKSLNDLLNATRHTFDLDDPIVMQLLWNDPIEAPIDFGGNMRGAGIRSFGKKAFERFMSDLGFSLMFRAHQVFPDGFMSFFGGSLFSVFSTAYNGRVSPKAGKLDSSGKPEFIPIF